MRSLQSSEVKDELQGWVDKTCKPCNQGPSRFDRCYCYVDFAIFIYKVLTNKKVVE